MKTKLFTHILVVGLSVLASSCKKENKDSAADDEQARLEKSLNFDSIEFCEIERAGKKYKLKIIEFSEPVIHDLLKRYNYPTRYYRTHAMVRAL